MTKPASSRALRRRQAAASRKATGLSALLARLPEATRTIGGTEAPRAARVVEAEISAAASVKRPAAATLADLTSGAAATRAGKIAHEAAAADPTGALNRADCRAGCAFCCVLSGEDGGVVTEHEAARVHAALAPFAGQPDGRAWHPRACPALDPDTRACRIYDARPVICRAYFSLDVEACRAALDGEARGGTAVLSAYPLTLAITALVRKLLGGAAKSPTYALAKIAAAAIEGQTLRAALDKAQHAPGVLAAERARTDPALR